MIDAACFECSLNITFVTAFFSTAFPFSCAGTKVHCLTNSHAAMSISGYPEEDTIREFPSIHHWRHWGGLPILPAAMPLFHVILSEGSIGMKKNAVLPCIGEPKDLSGLRHASKLLRRKTMHGAHRVIPFRWTLVSHPLWYERSLGSVLHKSDFRFTLSHAAPARDDAA